MVLPARYFSLLSIQTAGRLASRADGWASRPSSQRRCEICMTILVGFDMIIAPVHFHSRVEDSQGVLRIISSSCCQNTIAAAAKDGHTALQTESEDKMTPHFNLLMFKPAQGISQTTVCQSIRSSSCSRGQGRALLSLLQITSNKRRQRSAN